MVIPGSILTNVTMPGYTQFSFAGLIASTGSTALQFRFQDDPAFWDFDDVSVTETSSAVPETASGALLLGIGMTALLGARCLRSFRLA
jgi:hypothetical protein